MYLSIFSTIWLLLPIMGYGPIVIKTNRWFNNSAYIGVVEKTTVSSDTWLCAYSEEIAEWYWKALWGGIFVLPFVVMVAGNDPLLNLVAFMMFQLMSLLQIIPVINRLTEYVGKSANIAVRPRDAKGSAIRLSLYYNSFKDISLDEIIRGIDRMAPVGRLLVRLLKRSIEGRAGTKI